MCTDSSNLQSTSEAVGESTPLIPSCSILMLKKKINFYVSTETVYFVDISEIVRNNLIILWDALIVRIVLVLIFSHLFSDDSSQRSRTLDLSCDLVQLELYHAAPNSSK